VGDYRLPVGYFHNDPYSSMSQSTRDLWETSLEEQDGLIQQEEEAQQTRGRFGLLRNRKGRLFRRRNQSQEESVERSI
jgi:hypothetical protein